MKTKSLIKLVEWLKNKGQKILFFLMGFGLIIVYFGAPFKGYFTQTPSWVICVYIPSLLMLMLSIFLIIIGQLERNFPKSPRLKWEEAIPLIAKRIESTKNEIIIFSYTGFTFGEHFLNALLRLLHKNKNVKIYVLHKTYQAEILTYKMKEMIESERRWKTIINEGRLQFIYFDETPFLRGIIFDKDEGYLGYYHWEIEKFKEGRTGMVGDEPEAGYLHVSRKTDYGETLLNMYLNRFEYYRDRENLKIKNS